MKKIFLFETPSDAVGHGIGTYANQLIKALAEKENFFKLYFVKIVFNEADDFSIRPINANVDEVKISFKDKLIKPNVEVPIKPILARKIFCLLGEFFNDPTDIVFHLNFVLQYELGKLAKEYDFKLIYTNHVSLWRVFYENDYKKFLKEWSNEVPKDDKEKMRITSIQFEKRMYQIADHIICLNEDSKSFMKEHYSENAIEKISVIANGLNLKNPVKKLNVAAQKRKMGFDEDDFIFLFAGRMNKQKGLDLLVKTFGKLLKRIPNAKLLIVGAGDFGVYTKMCADFCARVVFAGYVDKSKINNYYAIANVGLVPSFTEQSSYVVLEMLSNQLPIIVSDIPAFEKPFKDKINVIKAETDALGRVNEKNLATQMLNLYKNQELRNKLSENGKILFDEHFTARQMAEKTIQLYLN
jgi:glycosyltransferase involved in cell wall biosynthesis